MPSRIETAILETLVYYDLFSYPLTILEIWNKLQNQSASYGEVYRVLHKSTWLKERMGCQNGVWFLKASLRDEGSSLSDERARRYRVSKQKINRARRFAHFARFIPWIHQIYACNSLGFLHASPESDIDLFVVTQRRRIWSTRFFSVILAKLFFGRPSQVHKKDGICLSFFAASGANLQKLALSGGDIYYEYWLKNLLPLTPHPIRSRSDRPLPKGEGRVRVVEDVLEKLLRWVQLKMLPAHLKKMAGQGTSVVINDEILKFHDHDRRDYYRKEFAKRLAAVA